MSEAVEKAEVEEFVKCNQGPAQIVPSTATVVAAPPSLNAGGPTMQLKFEHVAMRPVFLATREACGRHVWDVELAPMDQIVDEKACGNCAHGIHLASNDGNVSG